MNGRIAISMLLTLASRSDSLIAPEATPWCTPQAIYFTCPSHHMPPSLPITHAKGSKTMSFTHGQLHMPFLVFGRRDHTLSTVPAADTISHLPTSYHISSLLTAADITFSQQNPYIVISTHSMFIPNLVSISCRGS